MPESLFRAPTPSPSITKTEPSSKLVNWWRGSTSFERYCRHFIAILFWVYGVGQLLVVDLDGWLIAHLPEGLHWIINYKLLVFLSLSAVVLNFVPRRRFWSWAAYVVLYPATRLALLLLGLVLFLLKLKSWTAVFAVLNVIFAAFANFKVNLLIYVAALIGMVAALIARDPGDLASATILLVAVILALVARRLIAIFRPSPIFNVYVGAMAWIMDFSRKTLISPASLKSVDATKLSQQELEVRYGNLSTAIFLSELCGFLEIKFKNYHASSIAIATYLLALVGLLMVVILLLGFANLALFRADQFAFHISGAHDLFDFVYYAFGTVAGQRISEITPMSSAAKLISIMQVVLGWIFLAGTALSLLLSIKKDLDGAGIERAIIRLQNERQRMNKFVEEGFAVSLDEAIRALEGLKGGLGGVDKFEPVTG